MNPQGGAAPRVSAADEARVAELYRQDHTYAEISARTGLTRAQVRYRVVRAGCQRPRAETNRLHARRLQAIRPSPTPSPIGRMLRQMRESGGLTSNQLALASGLDQSAVSRIERGQRFPERDTLTRVIAGLGCTAVEASHLYVTAGYAPQELRAWHPLLGVIGDTLAALTEEERVQCERQLSQLVTWWQEESEVDEGEGST
jgi:transcriptional regulator with XRE-family HTH domain